MLTIRCKFVCKKVEKSDGVEGVNYVSHFEPVIGGSEENDTFYRYTPGGDLSLGVHKENHFEEGAEYYVDLTRAE